MVGPEFVSSTVILRLAAILALLCGVFFAYRWIHRESALLAYLLVLGISIRAIGSVALFAISAFRLPVLVSLQLGDGFWALAPDGRGYYDISSRAVTAGLSTISDGDPSPLYLRVLALWMSLYGVHPVSAFVLNIACYVASAVLIVMTVRHLRGSWPAPLLQSALPLGAITFSPALLVFGAQPLKDTLFSLLIIGGVAGAVLWWTPAPPDSQARKTPAFFGAFLLLISTLGISGIRSYMSVFVIVGFGAAGAYATVFPVEETLHSRTHLLLRQTLLFGLLCATVVLGSSAGAGGYERFVGAQAANALVSLDNARAGFVASAGATAFGSSEAGSSGSGRRLEKTLRGGLVVFVPVSLLRAASILRFPGGRGLLFFTDVDTVMTDVAVAGSVWVLFVTIRGRRLTPSAVYVLVLTVLTTAALGYVVTNYGTLFRLRLLAVIPAWLLPLTIPAAHREAVCDPDGERPCVE